MKDNTSSIIYDEEPSIGDSNRQDEYEQIQVQGRGRGRGRGRGHSTRGRGRGSNVITPRNNKEQAITSVTTGTRNGRRPVRGVTPASETDTDSLLGSQLTSSSSEHRRYPMRSCRERSSQSSEVDSGEERDPDDSIRYPDTESENDSDGSGHYSQTSASQKKGKKPSIAPKRGGSMKRQKDIRSTESTRFSPSPSLSGHALTRSKDKPKSSLNPLLLRLSYWIHANPDEEVSAIVESEEESIPTQWGMPSNPTNDHEMRSQLENSKHAIHLDTGSSISHDADTVRIDSSLGKRPRSPSLPTVGQQPKPRCFYPGQFIGATFRHREEFTTDSQLLSSNDIGSQIDQRSNIDSHITSPLFHLYLDDIDQRHVIPRIAKQYLTHLDRDIVMTEFNQNMSFEPPTPELMDDDATPRPHRRDLPQQEIRIPTDFAGALDLALRATAEANKALSLGDNPTERQLDMDNDDLQRKSGSRTILDCLAERDVLNGASNQRPTALGGKGLECGLIGLMEYCHEELITDRIRVSLSNMRREAGRSWSLPPRPLVGSGAKFVLERFERLQIPVLLFASNTPKHLQPPRSLVGSHSPSPSNTYLNIVTYFHLLGLRAITSARTGVWEMSTRAQGECSLSNFMLELSSPQAQHNRRAQEIFVPHFIQASRATLYSIQCITAARFTENKIAIAFNHALRTQIALQKKANQDEGFQAIHRQEHREATKIGKWLLLHQALKMADAQDIAHVVAKVGPDLCSSDESDVESDADAEMQVDGASFNSSAARSVTPIWRGPELATALSDLQYEGLYYGRNARGSMFNRSCFSNKVPPNGTPLSWIDDEYLDAPDLHSVS